MKEGIELNSLGAGFFKELSLVLKAVEINCLWTEIFAEAGNLFQTVGFDIKAMKK